jgi:hypothetical protein
LLQGVLSVSEGALVLGPALKRLALSGFTRIDPDNNQGIYAVMSPQAPVRIAPPDYPASPIHMGRSTLAVPQQQQQQQSSSQQQLPQGPQRQQQHQQEPGQQYKGWLSPLQRGKSGQGSSSFPNQLAWLLRSSANDDTPAALATSQISHFSSSSSSSSSSSGRPAAQGECKFRLELTAVTRADDVWVAAASTSKVAAAAAAVPPRAAMHSLHHKIGQAAAMQLQQEQRQPAEQEQGPLPVGYVVHPTGPVVDTASKNFWGLSWQEYLGVEQQQQQQQGVGPQGLGPQGSLQQQQQGEAPYPVPERRSAMEVPLPAGLNTVLQIPLGPGGSPSLGMFDEYEVAAAADADYAAGYEAGYAAAAAEVEAAASAAVVAAEAARSAAAAIAALPRQYQGSPPGSVRALKARDFPGMDKMVLNGASAAAWQAQLERSLIEQVQVHPSAPAAAPSAVGAAPIGLGPAPAAEAPSDLDSSSRYGVRNLFDAWLLPCSHPKQRDTHACQQQQLSSSHHASSSTSSRMLEYSSASSSSSQQQPRLHIEGLLISDNCQARWALHAVALPPGGLEVQALWYALLALLVCLVQVMLLRRQACVVTRSSAVALRVSLVGIW